MARQSPLTAAGGIQDVHAETLPAALVLNPQARQGDRPADEIVALLATMGVRTTLVPTEPTQLEATLRRLLQDGYTDIIVGGGDGTLSTAAHILCDHPVRMGVLPLGTANDFARSLGIPAELEAACAIIAQGSTVVVDVGVANGRRFLNVVSVGLPATVTTALTPQLKKRWGVLAYLLAAIQAIRTQRPFSVTLTVDGRRQRVGRVMQVAIGNGRFYGGGMCVTADAELTDGCLHIHVITAPNLVALLWTLRHLRSGRFAAGDSALHFHAQTVRVETRRARPINVDGELRGHTPLTVEVRPRCLAVFATDSPCPAKS